jgi:hypothetical protein
MSYYEIIILAVACPNWVRRQQRRTDGGIDVRVPEGPGNPDWSPEGCIYPVPASELGFWELSPEVAMELGNRELGLVGT